MADWLSPRLADLPPLFNNLFIQAQLTGTAHGLTAAQVTQIGVDDQEVGGIVDMNTGVETFRQAWRQFIEVMLYAPIGTPLPTPPTPPELYELLPTAQSAIIPRLRQTRGILYASPTWNNELAEAYGLRAPSSDPGTPKPVLRGTAETEFAVRLRFAMLGHDQLEIYSRRGSETEWTLITVDTNNPYVDGREPLVPGQPEVREYRARYRDDDLPVGEWSDVIAVTAQP